MSDTDLRASVIVPAYNAAATIDACLGALADQTLSPDAYELIVVDDGSTDSTPRQVEAWRQVRLLRQDHGGPARARNCGAEQARGEVLLFTDADCMPGRDWIERMLSPFVDQQVVGVKGAYTSQQASLVARFVQLEYEEKYARMAREERIDFIDTYAAGYRRQVFLAEGGFACDFPSASVEDQEFSFRLASRGYLMVFAPDATVEHLGHASSLPAYCRKKMRIGYWKVLVHTRHPEKLLRDSHTPQVLKVQIILLGLACASLPAGLGARRWRLAAGGFAGLFLLTTVPFVRASVSKDAAVALAAPGLLAARSLALGAGFTAGLAARLTRRLGLQPA